jgi:uncharacterized protein YkwD
MRLSPRSGLTALAAGFTAGVSAPAAVAAPVADIATQDPGVQDPAELAVIAEVNAERSDHGLPAVLPTPVLARAAASHSAEQARTGKLSHTSPDGSTYVQRLRRFTSAQELGEVIARVAAANRDDARLIVRLWMNSPSHRAVLLDARFRRMGVGARMATKNDRPVTIVTANFSTAR